MTWWYEGAGTTDRCWLVVDDKGLVIAITNAAAWLDRSLKGASHSDKLD